MAESASTLAGFAPGYILPDANTGLFIVACIALALWTVSVAQRINAVRHLWLALCTDKLAMVQGVGGLLNVARHLRRVHLNQMLQSQSRTSPTLVASVLLRGAVGEVTQPTLVLGAEQATAAADGAAQPAPAALTLRSSLDCEEPPVQLVLYGLHHDFLDALLHGGLAAATQLALTPRGEAERQGSATSKASTSSQQRLTLPPPTPPTDASFVRLQATADVQPAAEEPLQQLPPGLASALRRACLAIDSAGPVQCAEEGGCYPLQLSVEPKVLLDMNKWEPSAASPGSDAEGLKGVCAERSGRVPVVLLLMVGTEEGHWILADVDVDDSPAQPTAKLHSTVLSSTDTACFELQSVYGHGDGEDECVVCLTERKDIVLLPCRHMAVCHVCFPNLSQCPMCRTSVDSYLQLQFEEAAEEHPEAPPALPT